MNPTHTIELTIPSEIGCEKVARRLVGAVARHMGFAPERVEDLKTAIAEACLNAIEHGNRLQADAKVTVQLHVHADRLSIEVWDEGKGGPPPTTFPPPDIQRKIAGQESLRHMGLHVIQNLVDEAGFVAPGPDGGNRFRMVAYLPTDRNQENKGGC